MRRGIAVGIVAATVLLGACASDAYDPDSVTQDLRDAGLSQRDADCVVAEMRSTFGSDRLSDRGEPTNEERAKFDALLRECTSADEAPTS
ncbi:MAG TPA: hypothetical protein VFX21_01740 [Acidimicrobiia bacterium]|nr:hypothetical protein [Acidimicrobiia bacterium]